MGGATSIGRLCSASAIAVLIGVAGVVPATPASMSASPGLVAAYGFEEGSGTTVVDSSGSGNDGSIVNAARTSAGVFGSALNFDGSSARVIVPDSASLHLANAMTLEAWVKPSTVTNAWRDVINKGDDNYFLEATSQMGSLPAGGGSFGGVVGTAFGRDPLSTETWTHLALTYNGSQLRLYLDGVRVASVPRKRNPRVLERTARDRRRWHLRTVLPGSHRRGARVQRRPLAKSDSDRHGNARPRRAAGCGAAVEAGVVDGDGRRE